MNQNKLTQTQCDSLVISIIDRMFDPVNKEAKKF